MPPLITNYFQRLDKRPLIISSSTYKRQRTEKDPPIPSPSANSSQQSEEGESCPVYPQELEEHTITTPEAEAIENQDDEGAYDILTQFFGDSEYTEYDQPFPLDDELNDISNDELNISPSEDSDSNILMDIGPDVAKGFQEQFAYRIRKITSLMFHMARTAPRRLADSSRYQEILGSNENELTDKVLSLFTDDVRTILGAPTLSLEWLRDNLPHIGTQNRGCGIYTILGISGPDSEAIYVGCSYNLRYRMIQHESALRLGRKEFHVYDILSSYDRNDVFFRKIIEGPPLSKEMLFLVESIMMVLLDTIHSRVNTAIHPPGLIASIIRLQQELNIQRSANSGHLNRSVSLFIAWVNTTYQVTHPNPGYCEECGVPESIRCIYVSNFFGKWLCRRCRVTQRILLIPPDHELFNPCGWCGKPALRTLKMPRRDLETDKLYCWACFIYHRNHGNYHFLSCAQDITCACINCDSIITGPNRDAQRIRSHDGKWYCNWCWYWAAEHPNEEHIHERPGQCSCEGCLVYANASSPKERWLKLSPDGRWLCPWCLASDPDEPHDHVACVCPGCPRRNDQAPWGITEFGPMCSGCAKHLRLHPTWPHHHGPTPCQCPYGGHTGHCPAVLHQTSHPNATFMCKNCNKFHKRVKKGQKNQLHDHDAIRLRMQVAGATPSP